MLTPETLPTSVDNVMLNWVDWLIVGITVLSVAVSFWRGFLKEAISLVTWVLAFFLAFHYIAIVASWLKPWIDSEAFRDGIGFASIFFSVLLAGGIVNYSIGYFMGGAGLTSMDHILGMVFGFLRGILLVVIAVMLVQFTTLTDSNTWRHSVLLPTFVDVAQWFKPFIPVTRGQ